MLKKKENSLYKVRGKKLQGVYFAFETALGGKRADWDVPTDTVRDDAGSCSSSSTSSFSGACWDPALERKLGNRMCDPSLLRASILGRRRWPLPGSNGASSSALLKLPADNLFAPSISGPSFSNPWRSSLFASLSRPRSPYPLFRFPRPRSPLIRRFRNGIWPVLRSSLGVRSLREDEGPDGLDVVIGSSSWMSRSRSESESSAGDSGAFG